MKKLAVGYDFANKEAWISKHDAADSDDQIRELAKELYGPSVLLYALDVNEEALDSFYNTLTYLVMASGSRYGFSKYDRFRKELNKHLRIWSGNKHPQLSCSYQEAMDQLDSIDVITSVEVKLI